MELNLVTHSTVKKKDNRQKTEDTKDRPIKRKHDDDTFEQTQTWKGKKKKEGDINIRKKKQMNQDDSKKEDFISSLFSGNPDLPTVHLKTIKQKTEPVFSLMNVQDLDLHPHLISCLENRLDIKKLTAVQHRTIPALLSGKDALVKSQTGSGKTLAYAVPIIQKTQGITPPIKRSDGIHAVVVLPTRELALQTYEWFHKLAYSFTWIVPGCFCGGEKRKSEKARIRKGITILVSTPGRLVDHIQNTATLNLSKVQWLIVDEADRLLDMGYEKDVSIIIDALNNQAPSKQTVMLSATLSSGVENLANANMQSPEVIDVSSNEDIGGNLAEFVTPSSLKHNFTFIPAKQRLIALVSFICEKCLFQKSEFSKVVVFLPTLDMVKFYFFLFTNVLSPILPIEDDDDDIFYHLHGNMKQQDRVKVFNEFRDAPCGVLLTTDVAARGLELPNVDWIVQMSVPSKTEDYIHRVGRTARIGSSGHALIFLLPSECNFIELLESQNVNLNEIKCNDLLKTLLLLDNIPDDNQKRKKTLEDQANALQLHFETALTEDEKLHGSAKDAFLSYVRAYASYPVKLRHILPFKEVHLGHIAKSMCLRESPRALGATAFLRPHYKKEFREHISKKRSDADKPWSSSYKVTAVDTV